MRYMAVDYGSVRVGVAVSDPLGMIARGLTTLAVKGQSSDQIAASLADLVREQGVGTVVVGLPRRTDNRPGEAEEKARALAAALENLVDIPVVLQDERFTTVIAHRILNEGTVKAGKKRAVVDQVAAEVILTDYLNSLRSKNQSQKRD